MENKNVTTFLQCLMDAYISVGGHFNDGMAIYVTKSAYEHICSGLSTLSGRPLDIDEDGLHIIYGGFKFKINYHVPVSNQ